MFRIGFLAGLLGVTVILILVYRISIEVESELPAYLAKQQVPPVASEILDRDGQLIGSVYFNERYYVPIKDISQEMRNSLVASEDERFYLHRGFDIRGIIRAFFTNMFGGGGKKQGGSTITQQVARSDLFMGMAEQTIERKIKEIVLAYYLEKKYSKDEILEFYLNDVYFGNLNYGVEAAARNYFGKHAKDLTYPEAAMLTGLLPAPDYYNPQVDIKMAMVQQKASLVKLAKNNYISTEDITKYNVQPELKKDDKLDYKEKSLFYFRDFVVKEMKKRFTSKELAEGGFKIYTTIYRDYQMHAAEAIKEVFDRAIKDKQFSNTVKDEHGVYQPQGCSVVMEPKTGYILAMVGGRDYSNTQFNRTDRPNIRHPGSSFKVFDYCTALETMSVTGGSMLTSEPFSYMGWTPGEWGDEYFGKLLVRGALENSSNICALKTALRAGLKRVSYFAAKMGLKTDIPDYPSITVGSIDVTALDMCTGYNTVAAQGVRHDPVPILSIRNKDGDEIWSYKDRSFRAISEQTAFIMTSIFRSVIKLRRSDYNKDFGDNIAAKSGTSTDALSGWYCTYTPEITVVSYVGKDSRNVKNAVFSTTWGSMFASPINGGFINRCLKDSKHPLKITQFPPPPKDVLSYEVCKISGLRATEYCPHEPIEKAKDERAKQGVEWCWFRKGTEPTHPCPIHFQDRHDYMVYVEKDAKGNEVLYKPVPSCPQQSRRLPKAIYDALPVKECGENFEISWLDPATGQPFTFDEQNKPVFKVGQEVIMQLSLKPELMKSNIEEIEFYWNERRVKLWQNGAVDYDSPDQAITDLTQPLKVQFAASGNPGSFVKLEIIFRGAKNFYSKRDLEVELTP